MIVGVLEEGGRKVSGASVLCVHGGTMHASLLSCEGAHGTSCTDAQRTIWVDLVDERDRLEALRVEDVGLARAPGDCERGGRGKRGRPIVCCCCRARRLSARRRSRRHHLGRGGRRRDACLGYAIDALKAGGGGRRGHKDVSTSATTVASRDDRRKRGRHHVCERGVGGDTGRAMKWVWRREAGGDGRGKKKSSP